MKVQLILEGGGMRGIYTAGVLDFFMDQKIIFKDVVGVSAGAGTALSYLSNQPKRTYDMMIQYSGDKRYLSISSFIKTGSAFGVDFIFKEIPAKYMHFDYETFKNRDMKLIAVCSDLKTGKAVYHHIDDAYSKIDYVIASSSLPIVSKPVVIDNKELYDGGVVDPIPVEYSIDNGFDYQCIVLTRNKDYRKTKSLSNRIISRSFFRHKEFSEAISNRHIKYNQTLDLIEELETQKKAIVIRPTEPVTIDRFETEPDKLTELYALGYNDAKNKFQEILELSRKVDNLIIE
ncbi:MAG: patatin family protein [Bacilli bacterium]